MILFACPLMFLLLPLPFLVRRFLPPVKGLHGDALRVPFLRDIADISIRSGGMWRAAAAGGEKTSPAFWWLCLVWLFLTAAAARPQWLGEPVRIRDYGRDIMLVMDISTSMREPDFVLNRRRIDRVDGCQAGRRRFYKRRKTTESDWCCSAPAPIFSRRSLLTGSPCARFCVRWTPAWPAIRPQSATRSAWP